VNLVAALLELRRKLHPKLSHIPENHRPLWHKSLR
jgi:hypothetical protein